VFASSGLKLTLAKTKQAGEEYSQLAATVGDLCNRAGICPPAIWISPDEDPNAFVCGRSPKHTALVVHKGGLELWTAEQLKGVLAHEVAHIKNRDTLAMTIAVSLYETLTWICRIYLEGILGAIDTFGKITQRSKSGLVTIFAYACWLGGWGLFWATYVVLVLLVRPASALLSLAASRQQEYMADRTAAVLLGSGQALASALASMEEARGGTKAEEAEDVKRSWRDRLAPPGGWENVWSTHPPTARRVELLRNLVLGSELQSPEVSSG
jgi:heat shock protein HtpX